MQKNRGVLVCVASAQHLVSDNEQQKRDRSEQEKNRIQFFVLVISAE